MDYILRIIKSKKFSSFMNMAIDESLLLNNDGKNVILRFFKWEFPSISIGTFQKITELNIDFIKEKNIPIVRRPTGGKAVYHDDELTYSIIIPSNHPIYKLDILESYKLISEIFIESLKEYNIIAKLTKKSKDESGFCFSAQNYYEVSVDGKKIIGSAQRRKREGILQQGSIPFSIDYEVVKKIFNLNSLDGFTSLKELKNDIDIYEFEDRLTKNFIKFFNIKYEFRDLSEIEIENAKILFTEKYSKYSWNLYGYY